MQGSPLRLFYYSRQNNKRRPFLNSLSSKEWSSLCFVGITFLYRQNDIETYSLNDIFLHRSSFSSLNILTSSRRHIPSFGRAWGGFPILPLVLPLLYSPFLLARGRGLLLSSSQDYPHPPVTPLTPCAPDSSRLMSTSEL